MRVRVLLGSTLLSTAVACGAPVPATNGAAPAGEASGSLVSLVTYSGRENPPAKDWNAKVGSPVTVRVEGLGPVHAAIAGPDGAAIATTDAPFLHDGHVTGTDHRFVPVAPGVYRVTLAEAPGELLARITAAP